MIKRALEREAFSEKWGRQMRFIAGPRQCGKTTLAKSFLENQGDSRFYYNWDTLELRARFRRGGSFLKEDLSTTPPVQKKRWVCFDEIHKMPRWKNILKSEFDAFENQARFIVTGSARLDMFRRAGDSLAGRYFLFHLFPLSLHELTSSISQAIPFQTDAETFIKERLAGQKPEVQTTMESLLKLGGFPEPFLNGGEEFLRLWHQTYMERLVREDLRDLTRIGTLENVASLIMLLPERVGSPLSVNSLKEILLLNHATVKNYLHALHLTALIFFVSAHSEKLSRTLTKEKKMYFHDWALVPDEAKRFENYVAAELYGMITAWQDSGKGRFELRYIRTRDGREADFLILKNGKPWLLLEAKLKEDKIPSHFYYFSEALGKIPFVILVKDKNVLQAGKKNDWIVSASRFFSA